MTFRPRNKFGVFQDAKGKADRTADGIQFHSKKECHHYQILKVLERAGNITGLELQPRFPLIVKGVLICTYVADFRYKTKAGETVIDDVKGQLTPEYKLKRKLFETLYSPLKITEV